MTAASAIKRHGGKHYIAPKLVQYLPAHKHRVYPYAGGLSDLFAWPFEGVSEVANDLDYNLMNFWAVLQDKSLFADFIRRVQATPFSEKTFELSEHVAPGASSIVRAVAFFVRNRQSRQGLEQSFATLSKKRIRRGMNEQVSAWLSAVEGLPDIHARIKRVVLRNAPALAVIKSEDGPDTFFSIDPPYLPETRVTTDAYKHEMTYEDHVDLLARLGKLQGRFMLHGYPSDLYEATERLNGWRHVDFAMPNNASSAKEKEIKIERVWMNYQDSATAVEAPVTT
jgi:DNA adenine methylase